MSCFICPHHGPVCDDQCPAAEKTPCPDCPRVKIAYQRLIASGVLTKPNTNGVPE